MFRINARFDLLLTSKDEGNGDDPIFQLTILGLQTAEMEYLDTLFALCTVLHSRYRSSFQVLLIILLLNCLVAFCHQSA